MFALILFFIILGVVVWSLCAITPKTWLVLMDGKVVEGFSEEHKAERLALALAELVQGCARVEVIEQ